MVQPNSVPTGGSSGSAPAALAASVFGASDSTFRLLGEETDPLGMVHRRYQQFINGLAVEGAVAIQHLRQGVAETVSGDWLRLPPAGLVNRAQLSESKALDSALKFVGASVYKWQRPEEDAFLQSETGDPSASFYPKGQLVYYAGGRNLNGNQARLAYRFDIYAEEPLSRQYVYVDALNGKVLGSNARLQEVNASATAYTGYSGQASLISDFVSGLSNPYRLRENNGQGKNIQTYNLKTLTIYSKATDFVDADNIWGPNDSYSASLSTKDIFALDAHFGAEKTYDFYKNIFGRNSIDGSGFALKSYVHYSKNYFNAFWDGSRMTYGDGSSSNGNKPLTSLDVCGHEITHGLDSFTANLNYSYESGALNEAFSDIFGTAIEAYARGRTGIGVNSSKWNWTLGEDFNYVIRNMVSPKSYGDPDTYKGTNWYTGSSDSGGVHTNSGVLNYWFALLTEGSGSGVEHSTLDIDGSTDTNDFGYKFEVRGLGLDKSQAIAYRTLTVYLTSTSTYADARKWSLQSAADLVTGGLLTPEDAGEVAYAWNAVAVGGGTSSTAARQFTGGTGNDKLYGGHLADTITGKGGADALWGNGGADTFVLADSPSVQYYAIGGAADCAAIHDFSPGEDKLLLASTIAYNCQNNGANTDLYIGSTPGGELVASLIGVNLGSLVFSDTAATPGWATFA